jgi:multiple sugar transport system substrate-binding protein
VAADTTFKLDEFYPYTIARNCQIHNDKLYGLPNGESARVVYFNVDMFKEAGLTDPRELYEQGQWTHDAYFEAALALTKGEGAAKVFGTAVNFSDARATLTWVHQNGGNFFDKDFTESIINQPESVQTIQRLLELITVHKAAPSAQDAEILGGNSQALASKRLAMFPDCGIWCTTTLRNITDFEWDAVAAPQGTVDKRTAYPPHGYTIPVACTVPDEAWEFNKFITGPEVEKTFIVDGSFECKHPVNEQYFIENAPVKNSKLFIDWLKDGQVFYPPFNPMWPEMQQSLIDSLDTMLTGEMTVQAGLDDAKAKLDRLVAEVREKFPEMIPVVA